MSDHDTGAAAAAANEPIGQQATAIADTIDDSDLNLDYGDEGGEPQQRQDVQDEGPAAPEKPQRAPVDDGQEPQEGEEEAAEPEAKAEEPPAEDDEDAKAREAAAEDAKTVKIDGREIPVAEIKRSYMRQADYTRKTQELAQLRETTERRSIALQDSEAKVNEIFSLNMALAQEFLPREPDIALATQDPSGYVQQKAVYDAAMRRVDAIAKAHSTFGQRENAARQKEIAERERQQAERFQQAIAAEEMALHTKLPELRNPEKRQQFVSKVVKVAERYGLKEDEVLRVQDHRHVLMLKDLAELHDLRAAKPAAVERAKSAPPIPSAIRQTQGTRQSPIARATERLRRTGSVEDAAASLDDSWFGITR